MNPVIHRLKRFQTGKVCLQTTEVKRSEKQPEEKRTDLKHKK